MSEKRFHVVWTIDCYATTELEAAQRALAAQRTPESIATVFHVTTNDSCMLHDSELEDRGYKCVDTEDDLASDKRYQDALENLTELEVEEWEDRQPGHKTSLSEAMARVTQRRNETLQALLCAKWFNEPTASPDYVIPKFLLKQAV